jgi:hypothetical protein
MRMINPKNPSFAINIANCKQKSNEKSSGDVTKSPMYSQLVSLSRQSRFITDKCASPSKSSISIAYFYFKK